MSSPQIRLSKLAGMQRRDVPDIGNYGKLEYEDIKRLDRYIDGDIFSQYCCVYNGERKTNYITMSFRSKKISVLRLIYHNYVSDITRSDRILYLCDKKGVCCNINHITIQRRSKPPPPPVPAKRSTTEQPSPPVIIQHLVPKSNGSGDTVKRGVVIEEGNNDHTDDGSGKYEERHTSFDGYRDEFDFDDMFHMETE